MPVVKPEPIAYPVLNVPLEFKRKPVAPEILREIWAMPCAVCGCEGDTEADHVFPATLGGGNERTNIQPLCWQCNKKKGSRLVSNDQLREWVKSRGPRHYLFYQYRMENCRRHSYEGDQFREWLRKRGIHA